VELPGRALRTQSRNGFLVVLEYANEGSGPVLVDLSHRAKWDLQALDLDSLKPWGVEVPGKAGRCKFCKGLIIGRQSETQAATWHLGSGEPDAPQDSAATEITDGWMLLALIGPEIFSIMEKVTSLDVCSPTQETPVWIQGPVLHVPCQVVVLGREQDRAALMLACSRGYGPTMVRALLEAGGPWDLRPAGEEAFTRRLECWSTRPLEGDRGR